MTKRRTHVNHHITKLKLYLRDEGWHVNRVDLHKKYGDTERETNAMIFDRARTIEYSPQLRGLKLLYVLLHEAGHAIAYRLRFSAPLYESVTQPKRHPELREHERQAFFLGGALATYLQIPINQPQWRRFNWQSGVR